MRKYFRHRNIFMIGGSLIVLLFLLISDPNIGSLNIPFLTGLPIGSTTLTFLAKLATPVIAVWFAYMSRKALFDYLEMAALYRKAKETATGAALVFVGVCIVMFGLLGLFGSQVYAQNVATYIPKQALIHLPTLVEQQKLYWADHPKQNTLLV